MSRPQAILIGLSFESEARLMSALPGLTFPRCEPDPRAVVAAVSQHNPRVAVLAIDTVETSQRSLELIAQLCKDGVRVFVVGPSMDPSLILAVMRAGAREFVVRGEEATLRSAMREGAHGRKEGRALAFFSAKGGVGATSLATQLAGYLQGRNARVCLVEGNSDFGDLHAALDLEGGFTLGDILGNIARLDSDLLDSSIARHASGVSSVRTGDLLGERSPLTPGETDTLITFLKAHYDFVIVDGMKGFNEQSLAYLDVADEIIVVATQDVLTIRNTQGALELFRRIGYEDSKIKLVINHYLPNAGISKQLIEETIGSPVVATFSSDAASLAKAVEAGGFLHVLAPKSPLTGELVAFGGAMAPVEATVEQAKKRSSLARLFKKKG